MEKQKTEMKGKIKTLSFRVKKRTKSCRKMIEWRWRDKKTSQESMATAVNTLKESIEEK